VCVYNAAAFVLKWKLHLVDPATSTSWDSAYPVGQVHCRSMSASFQSVAAGSALVPVVQAVWGKEVTPSQRVLYDPINATQVTYVCRGTTLDFDCKQESPPPTAADVAKDVAEFMLGFADGLGAQIGFSECLKDLNATYGVIKEAVDFFKAGIDHKTLPAILRAFEFIGKVLEDVGSAISACVQGAVALAARIQQAAKALSGDVLAILKIVIRDAVHIYQDKKEITDDCKTAAAAWSAHDYKSAGIAIGDITAVVLDAIVAREAASL